ncbi:MAG: hypothetical protein RL748_2430 [Pseudomonadota bacterium]|jgi:CRISPR-associated protein Cmr6
MNNEIGKSQGQSQGMYAGFADAYKTALTAPGSINWALRFERFCPFGGKADGGACFDLAGEAAKFNWLKQFDGEKAGCATQLMQEHARRDRLCQAIDGRMFELELDWRFLTGSGNPHPIENGLSWHPTLGVPYLPASSFKGLLRAFLEHWQGDAATLQRSLFGDTQAAGLLQFFDLLPTEPVTLQADVMTPHHGNWYVAGGDSKTALAPENIPAPWHNPVPIPFLVVQQPFILRAMVAPARGVQADSLWDDLQTLIAEAFAVAGAGAKTASGYGRMTLTQGYATSAQAQTARMAAAAQAARQLQLDQEEAQQRQRAVEAAAQAQASRDAEKQRRENLPQAEKAQELVKLVLSKGNARAIAGYLNGKNFKHDLEEWNIARSEMKSAFHQDAQMLAHIRQWAGKKGDEGAAYEEFKPPKKSA